MRGDEINAVSVSVSQSTVSVAFQSSPDLSHFGPELWGWYIISIYDIMGRSAIRLSVYLQSLWTSRTNTTPNYVRGRFKGFELGYCKREKSVDFRPW